MKLEVHWGSANSLSLYLFLIELEIGSIAMGSVVLYADNLILTGDNMEKVVEK